MKKKSIMALLAIILCLSTCLTACMDETKAKADCTYYVIADSITYSDTLDLQYDTLVNKSLASLKRSYYTFTESASITGGLQFYAITKCDELAVQQFKEDIARQLKIADVQNEMYKANSIVFASQGITNAAEIPLHSFTLHLSLWNYTYKTKLATGDLTTLL